MSTLYRYTAPEYPTYRQEPLDYSKPMDVVEALRSERSSQVWRVLFHAPAGALDAAATYVRATEARSAKNRAAQLLEAAAEAQHAAKEITP